MTVLLIGLEVLTAFVAVALLVTAMATGSWSEEVVYFLSNALVFATMAVGIVMMVRVADLRPVPLTRASWWRELGTFRQFTNIPVAIVGATVALSLRDSRSVALAMVGLAAVLLSWARADRAATDEAVRRLVEAADGLSAAAGRMAESLKRGDNAAEEATCREAVLDALWHLERSCRKNLRRGIPGRPRFLVDLELISVISGCQNFLTGSLSGCIGGPLTAMVVQDLVHVKPEEFARQLQIFAGDIRRLATLTPASW